LLVGVFSPVINRCGGAEWVAINIISALKKQGHQVILLTDKPLNQDRFDRIFNRHVSVDQQVVFPFSIFPPLDYRNFYTDCFRSLLLRLRCDILIDTYSNAILPGMDAAYIHYPLFSLLQNKSKLLRSRIFYYPYRKFLDCNKKNIKEKLLLTNSAFTSKAVKEVFNTDSNVLYPPISDELLKSPETDFNHERADVAVTVGRISPEKNLAVIPYIAQKTPKDISFVIAGLLDSEDTLNSLLRLTKKLGVAERVKILPNVKRDHLRQLLLDSKIYLHPKENEHFGISIVEGMASGCVPVVHDSGGAKEFVPENLRYNSIEEAAEILKRTVDNWTPNQAEDFSKQAERFSERNFSTRFIHLLNTYSKTNE
jgi:alpha-1,2-mannosyltransferase